MKVIVAICSFAVLFFLASFQSAHALTYVDLTPQCLAYAKDMAREWNCEAHENAKTTCEASGVVNADAMSSFNIKALFGNISGDIAPELSTLCNENVDLLLTSEIRELKQRSVFGAGDRMIASLYANPPASGVEYIAYAADNIGFAKPAYAQGIGYDGLRPILPIWVVFRNISYLIVVVIFVIIGFMVMFRMRLDPQTVITVQSAIPNVVVALILITFSYMIAGLLIDLMYLVINLMVTVFYESGLLSNTSIERGPLGTNEINTSAEMIAYVYSSGAGRLFSMMNETDTTSAFGTALAQGGLDSFMGRIGWVLGGIGGTVVGFLILIALLFSFVRIFFMLLLSYIQIILMVIVGPFYLLAGALPGRNTFRNWIFSIIGNLSVFPTTIGLLLIGHSIGSATRAQGVESMWSPPFLFGPTIGNADLMIALINFGLIMLAPQLIMMVKNLFVAKPLIPISPAQLLQPVTGTLNTGQNLMQQSYYAQQAFGKDGLIKKMMPFGK